MCPAMSFIAAFLYYPYYEGFDIIRVLADWIKLMCYNFLFAFFTQLFFIQPFVRKSKKRLPLGRRFELLHNISCDDIGEIDCIAEQEHSALELADLFLSERENIAEDSSSEHAEGVDHISHIDAEWRDHHSGTEHHEDIEEVRADDISESEIAVSFLAAITEVISSGSEVPSATIVRPMRDSLIPIP